MDFLLSNYFIKVKFNLANKKQFLVNHYAVRVLTNKGPRYAEIVSFSLWGRSFPDAKKLDDKTLYKVILRNIQKYYRPTDVGNIIIDGRWYDVAESKGSPVFEVTPAIRNFKTRSRNVN